VATPVRSWLDGGVRVTGGSDSPVTPFEPLLGLWQARTRHIANAGRKQGWVSVFKHHVQILGNVFITFQVVRHIKVGQVGNFGHGIYSSRFSAKAMAVAMSVCWLALSPPPSITISTPARCT
jgi:hypothetical protein